MTRASVRTNRRRGTTHFPRHFFNFSLAKPRKKWRAAGRGAGGRRRAKCFLLHSKNKGCGKPQNPIDIRAPRPLFCSPLTFGGRDPYFPDNNVAVGPSNLRGWKNGTKTRKSMVLWASLPPFLGRRGKRAEKTITSLEDAFSRHFFSLLKLEGRHPYFRKDIEVSPRNSRG